jgi:hypothetical protein
MGTKNGTQYPERLMQDVLSCEYKGDKTFILVYKSENEESRKTQYEAEDVATANKIVNKITFLM